ncbi:CEF1 [Sanghuangporus sanghuang]
MAKKSGKVKEKSANSAPNVSRAPPAEVQFPSVSPKESLVVKDFVPDKILLIPDVFDESECKRFIKLIEELPLELTPAPKKGEAVRVNQSRISRKANSKPDSNVLKARPAQSFNSNIRMYKYTEGQHFGCHYDDSVTDPVSGAHSEWTLLIYLSGKEDGVVGGETIFYPGEGKKKDKEVLIKPELQRGMALLHRLTDFFCRSRRESPLLATVWKNTEDEVLKAAIAKYGKNQWARISSLLVRKTPKQCKARWYEWLDPSIKKTEWSKTEDEKLLHLAKLMPTQWRTIAPIVGRTATQCLERYQKLLDEAEAKENEELGLAGPGETGPGVDDVRKLRPGEIDPDPETKPARPDPIDMDEDEKEMLSEARARLANTQGKKAKRKARERQLEEARRLAMLQKKRELKAAGIIGSMRHKSKKGGMDYNTDIPFEKKAAPGFYDTSEEQAKASIAPVGQSLRRLENKRKPEEEEAERKKRQRKDGEHQTKFVAARDAQIQKLKEAEQIGKRRKLALPEAQVGEAELEEIVKIGQTSQSARALVGDGSEASEKLLGEYDSLASARMARTPRTAPQHDNVMTEARNLRNMIAAQTPLLGEENTPLHTAPDGGTGFEGATPRHQVAFTPNPLATPAHPDALGPGTTPRSEFAGATPLRTPLRDNLSLNPSDAASMIGDTPRDRRARPGTGASALRSAFAKLPKPENNFELLVPEDEDEETTAAESVEEDAAERDARLKRQREEEERRALARRSQTVQKGLPRPANVDVDKLLSNLSLASDEDPELGSARNLVHIEMARLLQHDAIAYPLPGTSLPGGTKSSYEPPEDDLVDQAKTLVRMELAASLGFPNASPAQVSEGLLAIAGAEEINAEVFWDKLRDKLVFDAKTSCWVDPSSLSLEDRLAGYETLLREDRDTIAKEANKAAKGEKKLGVQLGGYQARFKALAKRTTDSFDEMQKVQIDLNSFIQLQVNEQAVGPRRLDALKREVDALERRERLLQERYQELARDKEESEASVASLEEKIMAEAEALNEAALAEVEAAS